MDTGGEWDAKHRARRAETAGDVDDFVRRALDLLDAEAGGAAPRASGRAPIAWDLACGRGRHALELARRGRRVTAFDRSAEALAQVAAYAAREGLAVETARVDLAVVGDRVSEDRATRDRAVADWAAADWAAGRPRPDLIVVVNYLDEALFDALPALLAPGGALLVTTFTVDHPGEHPSARFRLARGALARRAWGGAEVCLSEESNGRAGILARIGAMPAREVD